MEVQLFLKDSAGSDEKTNHLVWVPITPEMKAAITKQNTGIVSMAAVVATPKMLERLHSDALSPVSGSAPQASGVQAVITPDDPITAALTARAVKPDTPLPPGITLVPPQTKTLAEASGMETTPEEEEEWANIRHQEDREFRTAMLKGLTPKDDAPTPEHSGFNVNYYSVEITHPKRPDRAPYIFEVEDLIQALNLGFHEGTILKSLVRSANEREHGKIKQGGDAVRDAEKMVHSSGEHLRALKLKVGK